MCGNKNFNCFMYFVYIFVLNEIETIAHVRIGVFIQGEKKSIVDLRPVTRAMMSHCLSLVPSFSLVYLSIIILVF